MTNLEDSGPGTLREACEAAGPRIIVFNVAGIIHLKMPVFIEAPYITIAGQTAPGDGICIAGESVMDNAHDVVIRYVRFRRGNTGHIRPAKRPRRQSGGQYHRGPLLGQLGQ